MRKFFLLGVIAALNFNLLAQTQKFATQFTEQAAEVPLPVRQEAKPTAWESTEPGPVKGLKVFARERSGAVWLGNEQGAARFDEFAKHRWDRWQYFAGRRWLRDDDVRNIWVDEAAPHRKVWIRTRAGVSLIEWRPMTLEQKVKFFEERIEARHVRHGLVADSSLRTPGDVSSSIGADNDNDGLWTAIYLGAQCYRYGVTHDADSRMKAQRALKALMRLEEITGVPGFYARSFVAKDEPKPNGGEWHPTPDGQWLWKGDTSSDESVGHYYGYTLYFDLVATEDEKPAIRQVVARMTDYLIKHDYDMPDLDGLPTRWGQWSETTGAGPAEVKSIFPTTNLPIFPTSRCCATKKIRSCAQSISTAYASPGARFAATAIHCGTTSRSRAAQAK
ncbi:MAG: hypothetical protein HY043_19100 [Verrucomicrobia bacterium]|nr:hypothetical protein [Verrucomicrobiota bacterium]